MPSSDRRYALAQTVLTQVSLGMVLGGTALVVAGLLTTPWLFVGAGGLYFTAGVLAVVRKGVTRGEARHWQGAAIDRARIGLGATVHATAIIEPGAVIEMGATVRSSARIEAGAVVRMGATVEQGATICRDAVVGWGATVKIGARVEQGASVGAGATVGRHAVLRAREHLGAGGTLASSKKALSGDQPAEARREPARSVRAEELESLCDQLEAELQKVSPELRSFLGTDERALSSLRSTWRELLAREQALRGEIAPERMDRLAKERAALGERIASANDEQVRASLVQALAALDEQTTQRERLGRNADRLDAELTRLRWSAESLISQLVQVRSRGGTGRPPELELGLGRVREELVAVTEALERMDHEEREGLGAPGEAERQRL